MIEIVKAGQFGKSGLLFDMHRLRTRVFKERLCWDVTVNEDNLEVDQFDIPEAVYLLSVQQERVVGVWRLLSSTGPTMIRDVWPQFAASLQFPNDSRTWEASRFAVSPIEDNPAEAKRQSHKIVAEMFCGLIEYCMCNDIQHIFTLYNEGINRMLKRIDCRPYAVSDRLPIDGELAQVGAFRTDAAMLARIRQATGITGAVYGDLFPETPIPEPAHG